MQILCLSVGVFGVAESIKMINFARYQVSLAELDLNKIMKIAVPTRDGRVDDHFGHCAYYSIFDVIDGKVTGVSKMASPEGCGCKSGIAPVLRQMGVAVMLAGNMGQGAKNVLEAQRIEVIRGCSGDVEELVTAYLAGNVKDNGEACDHHDCH